MRVFKIELRKAFFNTFSFFFGRMRLKRHSEKTDARPKREQNQRKRERTSSSTRKISAASPRKKRKSLPSPICANNKCGTMRKAKISHEDAEQYIFKRFKIFSATHKRVTQRGAEHKGPGPRWGTGEHRGGRRLVVDEHLLTTNVRRRRRLVVGEHLSTTNVRRWRDEML